MERIKKLFIGNKLSLIDLTRKWEPSAAHGLGKYTISVGMFGDSVITYTSDHTKALLSDNQDPKQVKMMRDINIVVSVLEKTAIMLDEELNRSRDLSAHFRLVNRVRSEMTGLAITRYFKPAEMAYIIDGLLVIINASRNDAFVFNVGTSIIVMLDFFKLYLFKEYLNQDTELAV